MKSDSFTQQKELNLEVSERILFQGYPKQIGGISLIIFMAIIVVCFLPSGGLAWQVIHAFFFLLIYCYFLTYRLTITTHRIILHYPFGMLTQYVKQQDLAKAPYLIRPSLNGNLLRKWLKLQNKDLFSHDASIKFVEHPYTNSTLLTRLNVLFPLMFNRQDQEQISQALQQYWKFDPQYIAYESLYGTSAEQEQERLHNDIGQSPLYLLILAITLGIGSIFVPFEGVHFGIESYLGLAPAGILAFLICYTVIRRENKKYPLATALVSSLLLGASFYSIGLHLNRWYSESQPSNPQTYILKLTETGNRYQTWQLTPELQEKTGLDEIYINEKWAGFNRNLKLGQSYPVSIYEGYFKDFWIQDDAFQQLAPIQESQP